MWPMRRILLSITLFQVFAVVQSSSFSDLPDRVPNGYGNGTNYRSLNENCNPKDVKWYPMEEDPRKFLYCDRRTRKLVSDMCASVNNVAKIFDERFQRCVMPALGKQRTPGSPRSSAFGEPCLFNTDCLSNMYCPNGICLCVAGYIDSNQACVPAVGPGLSRCSTDQECRASWPTTTCQQGRCMCSLPPDMVATAWGAYPTTTSEGAVCLLWRKSDKQLFCPLPIAYNAATATTWTESGPGGFKNDATSVTCAAAGDPCRLASTAEDWSDMAICLPKTADRATDNDPLAVPTTATYLCCPSRAHTCMQPRPTQTSGTGEPRYWYNQATGTCESVFWDGNVPYANNFKTREHCISYCGGICPRGSTTYTNQQPASCGSSTGCGTGLTCQTVASAGRQLCCQSQATICSANGGRNLATAPAPEGVPGQATANVERYYYNPTSRQCEPLNGAVQGQYSGWGGTFNNFNTMQECLSFCVSSACERGEPLKDANGQNQVCGRGCPTTYECRSNICCPKKNTVCIQPRRQGSCTQSVVRYWYNAASRDCEQFSYTGCGGNDNNFESYQTCVTYCRDVKPEPQCIQGVADRDSSGNYYTCAVSGAVSNCRPNYECYFDGYSFGCCPQRAYTCSLSRQIGSACVASTTRWYYDTTTRSCQTFTYNGCDGNSNNFINRQECERYCGVGGCPYGGEPYREGSGAIRVCNAQVTCPTGHACNTVGVSGSSLNYCCQTRAYICQQSPIQGSQCSAQLQRYYFNMATRQCATFTYFGCGGNENNFATLSQCNNFCGSAACLAGEAAYIDPNSNRALSCNPTVTNTCPVAYNCRSDTLTNTNVCCGSNDMGVCPAGERAYIEALTMAVRECQPSITSSCPNNYLCRPNNSRNRYYCCGTAATSVCPVGKAVYRSPDTSQPLACFVSTINQCPSEYSCQPTTTGQSQGFCCTISTVCPNSVDFYVETNTQLPRRCTVQAGGFNQCPTGYTCASNSPTSPTNGYCCRSGTPGGVCSSGQPYLVNGAAQQCVPNQPPFCASGYSCTTSSNNVGIFYCCSSGRVDGCPGGASAFVPMGSGTAQVCFGPGDTTCPGGYSCQLSPTLNRYQCCSGVISGDGCPNGMVVYREPGTTVIRSCTFGGNQCPSPYSCQQGTGRLQCCGLSGGCPSPMVAAINPSTGQPLVCTGGVACPFGFQCQSANNGQMTCCGTGTTINPPIPMTARCPFAGQTPYIVPGSGQVQTCRVGIPSCPNGYQCLNGGDGFVCCTVRGGGGGGTSLLGACPIGSTVYVNPVTNQAQTCANSFTRCPIPYQCQYSTTLRNYYCCSNMGVVGADENAASQTQTNGGCPVGEAPFFPRGSAEPAMCDKEKAPCQNGYNCTKIANSQKSTCCRPMAKAPDGSKLNADVEEESNSVDAENGGGGTNPGQCWGACSPGSVNACIRGYSCLPVGSQYLCCRTTVAAPTGGQGQGGLGFPQTNSGGGCPFGRAYMYPGTQAPLICQPGSTSCPLNHQCIGNLCCPTSSRPVWWK